MPTPKFVELVLTCGSWQEAQKIADELLAQRLVACVEFIEIKSKYWWEGAVDEAKEIKLIMETIADKFDDVEAAIKPLHSYKTFVLQMLQIDRLSGEASEWLKNALHYKA
jgi:periplasmic divalent cation tolerance protein